MFGTLKPQKCGLSSGERDAYDRFYCGLCKSLGDGFGQASRVLVSHDAVFLALVVDALSEDAAKPDKCRCPLLPIVHRPTIDPGGVAMRFASAVEILLGDQYLADRALEGKRLAKIARPVSRRFVDRAEERLSALGIDFSPLRGFEDRQAACEVQGLAHPAEAAKPTKTALAFVVGAIADLSGVSDAAKTVPSREALAELGAALGQIIYFADALDDLEKDFDRGDFNPCIGLKGGRPVLDTARVDQVVVLLRAALANARTALVRLPLARHREILASIVDDRLPRAARTAIAAARRTTDDARRAERDRIASLSWARRFVHHLAVFVAFAVAWLSGESSSSAQPTARPKPKPKPSASASAAPSAPASAAPSVSAPIVVPSATPSAPLVPTEPEPEKPGQDPQTGKPTEDQPEPTGSPCGNECSGCAEGCESCMKGCSDTCKKCPGCGDLCGDCGKACNCCDGCKGCGDPCKGCGDCCKGCGDPCKGCCDCKGCDCGGCGGGGGCC